MATLQNINTKNDLIEAEEPTQELADQGYVPVDTLNSDSLKNQDINYSTYNEPSVFDVSKLDIPEMQLTEPEEDVQEGTDTLQNLNKMLIGESAYRTEQEKAQDISGKTQTINDLTNQLKLLQAEQKQIPLQIQQESEGRGRTAGGVAPIETSRLRNNAIQALSTSALLQAAQGNLTTAQTLVDRAVAQKYDPVREQIGILRENLNLIKESPEYSIADKNRANKMLAIQEKREKELEAEEAKDKEILSIATKAAQAGVDAVTLEAIKNSDDAVEATRLAQEAGVYATDGEGFTLSPGQVRYDAQGNILAQAGELPPSEMEIMEFEMEALKTQAEIDKIYNDIERSGVNDEMDAEKKALEIEKLRNDLNKKQAEVDKKRIEQGQSAEVAINKVNDIQQLIDDLPKYGDSVVGPNPLARNTWYNVFSKWDSFTGKAQNYVGSVEQLVSQETMDTLVNLKSQGGTLGALSDQERLMLQNAATKIGGWKIEKDGKVVGYDIDEDSFKKELERIQSLTETALRNATGWKYISTDDFMDNAADSEVDLYEQLETNYPGLEDKDYLELINEALGYGSPGFNNVGSDTNEALPEKAAKADVGDKGGQCGRFVNNATGLGLGDSYQSKMAKMDNSITEPEPGMVFVMPYKDTGHTGFVVAVNKEKGTVTVKDSNYSLDEKVKVHEIPISKISGLRRVNNYA